MTQMRNVVPFRNLCTTDSARPPHKLLQPALGPEWLCRKPCSILYKIYPVSSDGSLRCRVHERAYPQTVRFVILAILASFQGARKDMFVFESSGLDRVYHYSSRITRPQVKWRCKWTCPERSPHRLRLRPPLHGGQASPSWLRAASLRGQGLSASAAVKLFTRGPRERLNKTEGEKSQATEGQAGVLLREGRSSFLPG